MKASQQLMVGFGALIVLGAAALLFLAPRDGSAPISALDALFTAASAVCVTGLSVVDTGSHFGTASEAVILALIQLGGVGILTVSNIIVMSMGHRLDTHQRSTLAGVMGKARTVPIAAIPFKVIKYSLLIEGVGALLLYPRFAADHPAADALWLAVFHSVSAFCNAGFSLFSDSLVQYRGDPYVTAVVGGLIVAGGLGFIVFAELSVWARLRGWRKRMTPLSLHTRVVVITSVALIVVGGALLSLLEGFSPARHAQWDSAFLPGVFLAVTARTAGFNTIETGQLTNGSLLVVIALMFIGASPGSCGGGIKTSTFAVLLALFFAGVRGRRHPEILHRRVAAETLSKSVATASALLLVILLGTFLLELTEHGGAGSPVDRGTFLTHSFEVTSAVCTVGLSTGVTPSLSAMGRAIVIGLMFIGRVGPLIIADSLVGRRRTSVFEYAEAPVMVG